jgi:hypothetical protein
VKPTVQQVILDYLRRGEWCAPHEVGMQLRLQGVHCAAEAVTARMRDLRKVRFGGHYLVKRYRTGTDYFEYRVERQDQKAA